MQIRLQMRQMRYGLVQKGSDLCRTEHMFFEAGANSEDP